jgi:hypothetical protein
MLSMPGDTGAGGGGGEGSFYRMQPALIPPPPTPPSLCREGRGGRGGKGKIDSISFFLKQNFDSILYDQKKKKKDYKLVFFSVLNFKSFTNSSDNFKKIPIYFFKNIFKRDEIIPLKSFLGPRIYTYFTPSSLRGCTPSPCTDISPPCTDIRIKTPYLPPIEDAYPLRGGWKGMGLHDFSFLQWDNPRRGFIPLQEKKRPRPCRGLNDFSFPAPLPPCGGGGPHREKKSHRPSRGCILAPAQSCDKPWTKMQAPRWSAPFLFCNGITLPFGEGLSHCRKRKVIEALGLSQDCAGEGKMQGKVFVQKTLVYFLFYKSLFIKDLRGCQQAVKKIVGSPCSSSNLKQGPLLSGGLFSTLPAASNPPPPFSFLHPLHPIKCPFMVGAFSFLHPFPRRGGGVQEKKSHRGPCMVGADHAGPYPSTPDPLGSGVNKGLHPIKCPSMVGAFSFLYGVPLPRRGGGVQEKKSHRGPCMVGADHAGPYPSTPDPLGSGINKGFLFECLCRGFYCECLCSLTPTGRCIKEKEACSRMQEHLGQWGFTSLNFFIPYTWHCLGVNITIIKGKHTSLKKISKRRQRHTLNKVFKKEKLLNNIFIFLRYFFSLMLLRSLPFREGGVGGGGIRWLYPIKCPSMTFLFLNVDPVGINIQKRKGAFSFMHPLHRHSNKNPFFTPYRRCLSPTGGVKKGGYGPASDKMYPFGCIPPHPIKASSIGGKKGLLLRMSVQGHFIGCIPPLSGSGGLGCRGRMQGGGLISKSFKATVFACFYYFKGQKSYFKGSENLGPSHLNLETRSQNQILKKNNETIIQVLKKKLLFFKIFLLELLGFRESFQNPRSSNKKSQAMGIRFPSQYFSGIAYPSQSDINITNNWFYYSKKYLIKNLIKKNGNQTSSILLILINLYFRFYDFLSFYNYKFLKSAESLKCTCKYLADAAYKTAFDITLNLESSKENNSLKPLSKKGLHLREIFPLPSTPDPLGSGVNKGLHPIKCPSMTFLFLNVDPYGINIYIQKRKGAFYFMHPLWGVQRIRWLFFTEITLGLSHCRPPSEKAPTIEVQENKSNRGPCILWHAQHTEDAGPRFSIPPFGGCCFFFFAPSPAASSPEPPLPFRERGCRMQGGGMQGAFLFLQGGPSPPAGEGGPLCIKEKDAGGADAWGGVLGKGSEGGRLNKQLWFLKKKKHTNKSLLWIFNKYWLKTIFKFRYFKLKNFKVPKSHFSCAFCSTDLDPFFSPNTSPSSHPQKELHPIKCPSMTFLFLNVYIINIYIQKRKGPFSFLAPKSFKGGPPRENKSHRGPIFCILFCRFFFFAPYPPCGGGAGSDKKKILYYPPPLRGGGCILAPRWSAPFLFCNEITQGLSHCDKRKVIEGLYPKIRRFTPPPYPPLPFREGGVGRGGIRCSRNLRCRGDLPPVLHKRILLKKTFNSLDKKLQMKFQQKNNQIFFKNLLNINRSTVPKISKITTKLYLRGCQKKIHIDKLFLKNRQKSARHPEDRTLTGCILAGEDAAGNQYGEGSIFRMSGASLNQASRWEDLAPRWLFFSCNDITLGLSHCRKEKEPTIEAQNLPIEMLPYNHFSNFKKIIISLKCSISMGRFSNKKKKTDYAGSSLPRRGMGCILAPACPGKDFHTLPPNKKTPPQGGWVGGPPFKRGQMQAHTPLSPSRWSSFLLLHPPPLRGRGCRKEKANPPPPQGGGDEPLTPPSPCIQEAGCIQEQTLAQQRLGKSLFLDAAPRWLFFSCNEITQGLSHCRPPSEKGPNIEALFKEGRGGKRGVKKRSDAGGFKKNDTGFFQQMPDTFFERPFAVYKIAPRSRAIEAQNLAWSIPTLNFKKALPDLKKMLSERQTSVCFILKSRTWIIGTGCMVAFSFLHRGSLFGGPPCKKIKGDHAAGDISTGVSKTLKGLRQPEEKAEAPQSSEISTTMETLIKPLKKSSAKLDNFNYRQKISVIPIISSIKNIKKKKFYIYTYFLYKNKFFQKS